MGKGLKEQDWREAEKIKVNRWRESKSQVSLIMKWGRLKVLVNRWMTKTRE